MQKIGKKSYSIGVRQVLLLVEPDLLAIGREGRRRHHHQRRQAELLRDGGGKRRFRGAGEQGDTYRYWRGGRKTGKHSENTLAPVSGVRVFSECLLHVNASKVLFYSTITARLSSGSAKRLFVSPSATFLRRSFEMPYLFTNRS